MDLALFKSVPARMSFAFMFMSNLDELSHLGAMASRVDRAVVRAMQLRAAYGGGHSTADGGPHAI